MPEIITVAWPNGAGKTSFANEFKSQHSTPLIHVNADDIARQMAAGEQDKRSPYEETILPSLRCLP